MKRNFVIFFSPGTFMAEESERPIATWDVPTAVTISRTITERYGAKPYGFCFITRSRTAKELNSRVEKQSPMYYLGGTVLTLQDVESRNDPRDHILLSNMRNNGWDRVIQNDNSLRWTQPLEPTDVVLDMSHFSS